MKTLNEFLGERSFADFLKAAQSREKNPLDYANDAKNPIVYQVKDSVGAERVSRAGRTLYVPLKKIASGSEYKQALKSLARNGFAVIRNKRYAVFTGPADMQARVYNASSSMGVSLENKEVDDAISKSRYQTG